MRAPHETDFTIDIPGIGTFRFGRRKFIDRLLMQAELLALLEYLGKVDPEMVAHCVIIAAHTVLCVDAPEGWRDLKEIDLIAHPDFEERIHQMYSALLAVEDAIGLNLSAG